MLCCFSSCSESQPSITAGKLFDSEKYFTEEASRLSSTVKQIAKTSDQNGSVEVKALPVTDWKKELQPFILCNINKASLQNSYAIDSLINNLQKLVSYTALEPALAVQKVEVVYSNQRITRVSMETHYDNMLYALSKKFIYLPDSGYTISGQQKIIFSNPTIFTITASWN